MQVYLQIYFASKACKELVLKHGCIRTIWVALKSSDVRAPASSNLGLAGLECTLGMELFVCLFFDFPDNSNVPLGLKNHVFHQWFSKCVSWTRGISVI